MDDRLFDAPADPAGTVTPRPVPASSARPGAISEPVSASAPLAARMRPRTLDEFVGHAEPLAPVVTMLARGELSSIILWGPPGVGKTSLAAVVSVELDGVFTELSAVTAGVKDVRAVVDEARARLAADGTRTVLFLDEIHRFNKSQQDALLPAVEAGWISLVGATTENPFFEINAPLMSRCKLVQLSPLTDAEVERIIRNAIASDRGYRGVVELGDQALRHLTAAADGDARAALNALEVAVTTAATRGQYPIAVTEDDAAVASKRFRYDKAGDSHYDQVSAFIKSMRGSDPDAAVYWLLRMLASGEDPRFVARRMIIFASEDIGLADRSALPLAVAAFEALDRVGLPEARYALAHAAISLAVAPKSNSVTRALRTGQKLVDTAGNAPVPAHLRDAHYKGAKKLGHGLGYDYPHDHPGGFVPQQYLPDALDGQRIYEPTSHGHEGPVAERLATLRRQVDADRARRRGGAGVGQAGTIEGIDRRRRS